MDYLHRLRSRLGSRKIFLPFASIVLRDARGRILLQQRTDFDFWGLPGGIMEPGENIVDCACRELREESGLSAGPLELVGVYTDPRYDVTYPNGDRVQQFTVCLAGRRAGGEMQVDGVETRGQRFFAPEELPWERLPVHYSAMLRDALAGGPPAFLPPAASEPVDMIAVMRAAVGQEVLIGVGAIAVVLDEAGRLLLAERCDDGLWHLPSGYSLLGENAAAAAAREVREETGLRVRPERLLGVYSPRRAWTYPNGDRTQALAAVFLCRPEDRLLRPGGTETRRLAWMAPAEVLRLETHPMLAALNRAVVERLEGGSFVAGEASAGG